MVKTAVNCMYRGSSNKPIMAHVLKLNPKTKKYDLKRASYTVSMIFGNNWRLSARENATRAKYIASKVAEYLQKHGTEIVNMALTEK